jgi:hypothetical protein
MSDTPIDYSKMKPLDHRPKLGWWAPGEYMCKCFKCQECYIGDKRSGMCADCAYALPVDNTASTSEFGGSEPLLVDYYKTKIEGLRAVVARFESIPENVEKASLLANCKNLSRRLDNAEKQVKKLEGVILELNAMTEERDELKEEVKSLKEAILDQESHILELQSLRPFTPGYTADP